MITKITMSRKHLAAGTSMQLGPGEIRTGFFQCVLYLPVMMVCAAVLCGCSGRYFHDAEMPPVPPAQVELAGLPYSEYWTGVILGGNKIGFTRFAISASEEVPGYFEIRCEAVLHFRFLMMDKKISLVSQDLIGADLTLKEFRYEYDFDGNKLTLSGYLRDGKLEVKRLSSGHIAEETMPVEGPLYPGSILYLYPAVHGLTIGRTYRYDIFDSEAQSIETVAQEILAYQQSDLFIGKGFKVKTGYFGQEITTWIDDYGRPLYETALGGVLVSGLESESRAKTYLLESTLNRDESLLEFSLIRTQTPILDPGKVTSLEVLIGGLGSEIVITSDDRQICERRGSQVHCRIDVRIPEESDRLLDVQARTHDEYLVSSYTVPCNNSEIAAKAKEIAKDAATDIERIDAILQWIGKNIEQKPIDVFSALDVLTQRKGECQGHAYLYTAFARALGIPTRVVSGIVYAEALGGFLYHSWAESLVADRWVAIDPITGQLPADATHVKFIQGEDMSCLVPLVGIIGKVELEVLRVEY